MSTVSIIIAVYNGEKYLEAAIESVLAQTYPHLELLIINDGSTDNTRAIINKYAPFIRSFHQDNQGQPATQNRGIREATGDYISFLDADDLYYPHKIASQVAHLQSTPHLDMVFGHVEQFICPALPDQIREKWRCPPGSSPGYLAAAGLFRKATFEKVGFMNEKNPIGLFIDWYMRATEAGMKHVMLSDTVFRRRIHGNNIGIREQNTRLEYLKIVKAALKRRESCGSYT